MEKEMECYIQGAQAARQMTASSNRRARRLFHDAINANNTFARAYGYLSYSLLLAYLHGWKDKDLAEDNEITPGDILNYGTLAQKNGPDDYENYWSLAAANIYSGNYAEGRKRYTEALGRAKTQAIPLNLSCLRVEEADAKIFGGTKADIEDAVKTILEEMKMPDFPNTHFWALGWAYYELGAFDPDQERDFSLKSLEALLQIPRPHVLIKKNIIANYSALGWNGAAEVMARQLAAELPPGYTVAEEWKWPYGKANESRQKRYIDHLSKAGLP